MSHKYVYLFKEGNGCMRELLGGKGANLAEMTNLGMPVPYGFTVSTEACTRYYDSLLYTSGYPCQRSPVYDRKNDHHCEGPDPRE